MLWGSAACAGVVYSIHYENKPGDISPAPSRWPMESRVIRPGRSPTLLVFLHPECGCSNATYSELAEIMSRNVGNLHTVALFSATSPATGTASSKLVRTVQSDSRVDIIFDSSRFEQQNFGAKTSGLTLLYDADGTLLFEGGITSRRGHAGDNVGRQAVLNILAGKTSTATRSPVFGCRL